LIDGNIHIKVEKGGIKVVFKKGYKTWNKGMKGVYHLWDKKTHPMKGKVSSFKGKHHSEKVKSMIRKRMLGNKIWLGRKHTEEAKEKMKESALGRKASIETKEKMSKSRLKLKGGKTKSKLGYIKILSKNHPNKDTHGYVFEHRLVMEKSIGRYLTKKEVVHHKNEIRDDNRIKNLRLFKNCGEHKKFHLKQVRDKIKRLTKENNELKKKIDNKEIGG